MSSPYVTNTPRDQIPSSIDEALRLATLAPTPAPKKYSQRTVDELKDKSAERARLSTDSDKRKEIPLASGCLDYFPDALAAVAALSWSGNQKHNPGEELHWARGKSTDEADCLLRHLAERGTIDTDGHRHSTKVAWRALANLQKEIEAAENLPISRGSRP